MPGDGGDDDPPANSTVATMHDLVALGEIGDALSQRRHHRRHQSNRDGEDEGIDEEETRRNLARRSAADRVLRLPLLLRLLAAAQPHSSVPPIPSMRTEEEDPEKEKEGSSARTGDGEDDDGDDGGKEKEVKDTESAGGGSGAAGGATKRTSPRRARREGGGDGADRDEDTEASTEKTRPSPATPPTTGETYGPSRATTTAAMTAIDRVVASLEEVAARHPSAEGVEILTSHLAPHACRKISRFGPLRRTYPFPPELGGHHNVGWRGGWDVRPLQRVTGGSGTAGAGAHHHADPSEAAAAEDGDGHHEDKIAEAEEDEDENDTGDGAAEAGVGGAMLVVEGGTKAGEALVSLPMTTPKKRKVGGGAGSAGSDGTKRSKKTAAELISSTSATRDDSQESAVARTLSETSALVAASLEADDESSCREFPSMRVTEREGSREDGTSSSSGKNEEKADGGGGAAGGGAADEATAAHTSSLPSTVALSVKADSLLFESSSTGSEAGGGDLSAILPSILHHTPALRHRHVANALCRAALPDVPSLVARMAANCPAASRALVRGCVDAYLQAEAEEGADAGVDAVAEAESDARPGSPTTTRQQRIAVMELATDAVRMVAALSPREASNVTRALTTAPFPSPPPAPGGEGGDGDPPYCVMPGLVLSLRMVHDPTAALAMLLDEFRRCNRRPSSSASASMTQSLSTAASADRSPVNASSSNASRGRERGGHPGAGRGEGSGGERRDGVKRMGSGNEHYDASPSAVSGIAGGGGRRPGVVQVLRRVRSHPYWWMSRTPRGRKSLAQVLDQDASLAMEARRFLAACMSSMLSRDGVPPYMEAALVLRVYALTVHRIGLGSGSSVGSGSSFVDSTMTKIEALAQRVLKERKGYDENSSSAKESRTDDGEAPTSRASCHGVDSVRRVALCACLVTCAQFPPIANAGHTFMAGPATNSCATCLSSLLTAPSVSLENDVFAARIASCISSRDGAGLRSIIVGTLVPKDGSEISVIEDCVGEQSTYLSTCKWAAEKVTSDDTLAKLSSRGTSPAAIVADVMAVVDESRRGQMSDRQLDTVIKNALGDSQICDKLFYRKGVLELFDQSTEALLARTGPAVPAILPLHIEALGKKVNWDGGVSNGFTHVAQDGCAEGQRRQFVLQLLYTAIFMDKKPDSPFAIDLRMMPLREVLNFCDARRRGDDDVRGEAGRYYTRLRKVLFKWCPDILSNSMISGDDSNHFTSDIWDPLDTRSLFVTPKLVSDAIRGCVHGEEKNDPSGCRAESLFLYGRAKFAHPTVDTAAACALLSSKNSPPPYHSYSALCKDPLLILRCNMLVWRCRGLRRIALLVLQRLLEANSHITSQFAPTAKVAHELLSARDLTVVRCLVIGACGVRLGTDDQKNEPTLCPLTVNMVRSIIARRNGLVAMMIKQGLPDEAVDFVVEFVPESLLDAPILQACLSGRNSLTAAERLAAADAALRIAITHGIRDEKKAQPLLYAALTVFVSSFFLVLGPVGLAVNVLCEEEGEDVTEKCRKSYFRMLMAMQGIGGQAESLKSEAIMALHKIAGFCKSESVMSGVAGLAAMRRKAVLKEIWDASNKTINVLGGSQL